MVWDDHMIGQRDAYSQVAAATMGRATFQIWVRAANEYEPSPNHAGTWSSAKPERAVVWKMEVAGLAGVE